MYIVHLRVQKLHIKCIINIRKKPVTKRISIDFHKITGFVHFMEHTGLEPVTKIPRVRMVDTFLFFRVRNRVRMLVVESCNRLRTDYAISQKSVVLLEQ